MRIHITTQKALKIEYQHQNLSWQLRSANRRMRQKDEKAQLNQFLGEYLRYCLAVGGAITTQSDLGS